jgi:superfamily II DNA/RNA helicase
MRLPAAQTEAWPAIRACEHVLVAAPTGSGKTLAAFLVAIDSFVRQGLDGRLDSVNPGSNPGPSATNPPDIASYFWFRQLLE